MPAPPADKPDPAPRPQLKLDDVITFLARYLYCTEHQRTLIALWVSPCSLLSAAEVTPYLSIQSAVEQSGKTLSLQLLSLLCPHPSRTAQRLCSAPRVPLRAGRSRSSTVAPVARPMGKREFAEAEISSHSGTQGISSRNPAHSPPPGSAPTSPPHCQSSRRRMAPACGHCFN